MLKYMFKITILQNKTKRKKLSNFSFQAKCFHAVQYFKGVDFFPRQLLTQGQLGNKRILSDKTYTAKNY